MNSIILEYQNLDKKIKNIKNEVNGGSAQKNIDNISNSIKTWQTKILELEETSKELLSSLNKLMEVEKKGIAYVEKCKKTDLDKMSKEEQNEILSKRVATKKVRCKNWPNCKDPNCIYAHPTQTVSINFNFIILIK